MIRRKYKPPKRPSKKAIRAAIDAQWHKPKDPDPVDPGRRAELEAAAAELQADIEAMKTTGNEIPF